VPFKKWFRQRAVKNIGKPPVILWADTFNNYFFPETAQAAVEVLEHLGFQVRVPMQHLCCGRPLYDYGFLDRAKSYLTSTMDAVIPEIDAGASMVVLEPSCCSVFRDELNGLMPESARAHRLMEHTFTLSEFVMRNLNGTELPKLRRKAIVQGHCHHKAIMRFHDEEALMKKIDLDSETLASGCCGMAGSFGYEADKYEVSIKCGERALLPSVRKADLSTLVIADGFSCREQIAQETSRHALHLAEVMQLAMKEGPNGGELLRPERAYEDRRKISQHRSMKRAAGFLGIFAGIATAAWLLVGRKS